MKMSNRFLVGVPDLFVKLPATPAALIEVKFDKRPRGAYRLRVTPKQAHVLRQADAAGMPIGVASFLQDERQHQLGLLLQPDVPPHEGTVCDTEAYTWMKRGTREATLQNVLQIFLASNGYDRR